MTDNPAVRRLVSQMPHFWYAEAKTMVARHIVYANNNTMAHDAKPDSLDADINAFFHSHLGSDQMPPSPSSVAMMPPSLGDNYTGGHSFHMRNHNASDQDEVGEILQLVNQAASRLSDEDCTRLWQGLQSMFGNGGEPTEDQGSSLRLPAGNGGEGVTPGEEFFTQQGMSGKTAGMPVRRRASLARERDPLTGRWAGQEKAADQQPAAGVEKNG